MPQPSITQHLQLLLNEDDYRRMRQYLHKHVDP